MHYLFLLAMVLLGACPSVSAQISFASYQDVQTSPEAKTKPELRIQISPKPVVDRVNLAIWPAPKPRQVLKLLLKDEKGNKVIQLAGTLKNLNGMLQRVTYKLAAGHYQLGISTGDEFVFEPMIVD